jgi:hypothetical protein
MLPCNVIVQELGGGVVEVAAVDPAASMAAVDNPKLGEIAGQVRKAQERHRRPLTSREAGFEARDKPASLHVQGKQKA